MLKMLLSYRPLYSCNFNCIVLQQLNKSILFYSILRQNQINGLAVVQGRTRSMVWQQSKVGPDQWSSSGPRQDQINGLAVVKGRTRSMQTPTLYSTFCELEELCYDLLPVQYTEMTHQLRKLPSLILQIYFKYSLILCLGITSLTINPEGNPISGKPWRQYAIYRLEHWGLLYRESD